MLSVFAECISQYRHPQRLYFDSIIRKFNISSRH